jgi:hypothetical protein
LIEQLDWSARIISRASSVGAARDALLKQGNGVTRQWARRRRTRRQVADLIDGIRRADPTSPVLR